jgi:hypothetical protein
METPWFDTASEPYWNKIWKKKKSLCSALEFDPLYSLYNGKTLQIMTSFQTHARYKMLKKKYFRLDIADLFCKIFFGDIEPIPVSCVNNLRCSSEDLI